MTTPANTPPTVCPECGKWGLLRRVDTSPDQPAPWFCDSCALWYYEHEVATTPTDEGRGTEQTPHGLWRSNELSWMSPTGASLGQNAVPNTPNSANSDNMVSPQQGGGEEADLAALALEAMQVATKRAVNNGTGVILPWGVGMSVEQQFAAVLAERDRLRTALAESQRERDEARGMFEWAEHQRAVAQAKLAESQRREQEAREQGVAAVATEVLAAAHAELRAEEAEATVARLTGELAEVRQYAETWLEEFCDGDEWTVAGVIRKAWEEIITQRGTNAEIAAEYGRKLAAAEATLTALRSANTQLDNLLCCARDSLFSADPAECAARAEEIDQELPLIRAEALTPSDTGSQG